MDNVKWRLDEGQIEVVDDSVAEILKKKAPHERLKIASGMWNSAKVRLLAYNRSVHPDWNDERVQKEVVRRLSHGTA